MNAAIIGNALTGLFNRYVPTAGLFVDGLLPRKFRKVASDEKTVRVIKHGWKFPPYDSPEDRNLQRSIITGTDEKWYAAWGVGEIPLTPIQIEIPFESLILNDYSKATGKITFELSVDNTSDENIRAAMVFLPTSETRYTTFEEGVHHFINMRLMYAVKHCAAMTANFASFQENDFKIFCGAVKADANESVREEGLIVDRVWTDDGFEYAGPTPGEIVHKQLG